MQVVKHNLLLQLGNLLIFTENHVTLALHRTSVELRVLQNVRDDVHSRANVLAERLGVKDRLLARSVRVQVSTNVLDLNLKVTLRTVARTCMLVWVLNTRTLESHVLQKVGRAVVALVPRARTGIDPGTNRSSLRSRVRLRGNSQTVREHRDLRRRLGVSTGRYHA